LLENIAPDRLIKNHTVGPPWQPLMPASLPPQEAFPALSMHGLSAGHIDAGPYALPSALQVATPAVRHTELPGVQTLSTHAWLTQYLLAAQSSVLTQSTQTICVVSQSWESVRQSLSDVHAARHV
jgi:hypothetical protein